MGIHLRFRSRCRKSVLRNVNTGGINPSYEIQMEIDDMCNKVNDTFASYHPLVNIIYFICVIGFATAFTNPVCLGISFIGAFIYSVCLRGREGIRKNLIYMLPLILFTAVLNPAFSHQGVTILAYLPSGNPLTLESILYGISAAFMLVTVICWFVCLNEVITSDKLVYLFGRLAPYLSLLLSMTLRFVPEFAERFGQVYRAQKAAGYVCGGKYLKRTRTALRVFSTVVTWALERAVVTADSMKSRGYGLKGRKAYSIYRFKKRDGICMIYILLCTGYVLTGGIGGTISFTYYPAVSGNIAGTYTVSVYVIYELLVMIPVILRILERRKFTAADNR